MVQLFQLQDGSSARRLDSASEMIDFDVHKEVQLLFHWTKQEAEILLTVFAVYLLHQSLVDR